MMFSFETSEYYHACTENLHAISETIFVVHSGYI
jgi:hypothetical protein